MQLDGLEFPTLRFDETYVTWEQINGVIVIDEVWRGESSPVRNGVPAVLK